MFVNNIDAFRRNVFLLENTNLFLSNSMYTVENFSRNDETPFPIKAINSCFARSYILKYKKLGFIKLFLYSSRRQYEYNEDTFECNFDLYQAFKQYGYTQIWKQKEAVNLISFSFITCKLVIL